jgi:RNA polymerase sigma-70 factor (ECF subfamily)
LTDSERLAEAFEAERQHLRRIAYAVLGSVGEAEDVVQEAWVRLERQPHSAQIRDLRAWLTTTVSRLALDTLSSARVRREQYVGTWLPEPLVGEPLARPGPTGMAADPADKVTLDESISLALMIVLERLTPAERAAFLLHDVFGFTFTETADVVGRPPATVRKLAERARRHVEEGRPRFPPTRARQAEIVTAFRQACTGGDMERLVSLLDPDVVWRTDSGGKVKAARVSHYGAAKVARGMLGLARLEVRGVYMADVNGAPGLVLVGADDVLTVISLTVDADRITAIDIIRKPDKLTTVQAP